MDQIMVDVTALPGPVEPGDEVVSSRLRTVVPGTPVQKRSMNEAVSELERAPNDEG